MTTLVTQEDQKWLDSALKEVFEVLRQLECDETTLHPQMDNRIMYIITTLLDRIYNYSPADLNSALGILERVKLNYYTDTILPNQRQNDYDNAVTTYEVLD